MPPQTNRKHFCKVKRFKLFANVVNLHIAITAPEEKPCEVAAAQRATAEPQVRFNAIAPANVPVPCAFECLRPRANPITRPITGLEAPHGANEHG